jgi:hypothetical protein
MTPEKAEMVGGRLYRFRSAVHLRAGCLPGRSPDILVENRERAGLGESAIAR